MAGLILAYVWVNQHDKPNNKRDYRFIMLVLYREHENFWSVVTFVDNYALDAELLNGAADADAQVREMLHSHLLKSNCLVTSQPDWGSVLIHYQGAKINQEALLRYLISFRQHDEFHEQCVERIYNDLMRFCRPEKLTVYARYTRRGGLDINPYRSNFDYDVENLRLARQ